MLELMEIEELDFKDIPITRLKLIEQLGIL